MKQMLKFFIVFIAIFHLIIEGTWAEIVPSLQNLPSQSVKLNIESKNKVSKQIEKETPENIETKNKTKVNEEASQKIFSESSGQNIEISFIEKGFLTRIKKYGFKLKQFGYDFFKRGETTGFSVPIDKSYVLGPGDELFVYIIGQIPGVNLSQFPQKLVVDREGKIYFPGLGVFYVWGLTLGEAEKLISKTLKIPLKLTVGKVRTFPVYVCGEVVHPGPVQVTAFHTLIDALIMAGGVKKTGSLRHIILTRKKFSKLKRITIDFYDLLLKGKPIDIRLRDGDVIFVPPIKNVAGIAGGVRRPAIYEFKKGETIKDLINMAGGLLPSAYKYKLILQRYEENEYLKVLEGSLNDSNFMSRSLKDGDLIIIKRILPFPQNFIEVRGYTPYPGMYEYKKGITLSKILTPDLFFVDTNTKFGLITRRYPLGSPPKYITFIPEDILSNKTDIKLYPGDIITLYPFGKVKDFDFDKIKNAFVVEGEIKYPGVYAYKKGIKLSDILSPDMLLINTNLYYAEIDRRDPETLDIVEVIRFSPADILAHKKDIEIKPLDIIHFYPKYIFSPIKISGCVKNPGYVPYHEGITLKEVLSGKEFCDDIKKLKVEIFRKIKKEKSAESLKKSQKIKAKAETEEESISEHILSIYLYDLLIKKDPKADVLLFPGDNIIVQRIKKNEIVEKVTVAGYVVHPGVYPITEKTTLYDVLKRAGGFREGAYPEGIIVLRKSVAEMHKKLLQKAIILMQKELQKEESAIMKSALPIEELKVHKISIEAQRKLLQIMMQTEVTGRITGLNIPKNLELLKNSPYNILLEDEDQIIVPKEPSEVFVLGEVYNPSALVYQPGLTVKDYIDLAGGFTRHADIKEIFVIKPNGAAHALGKKKILIFRRTNLHYIPKPGEAIIIPIKIKVPVVWRPLIRDVVQIIYQSILTVYTITHL